MISIAKVIELIFTTTSKFIVISFRLKRNCLKRPDSDGKTVQLVDMKYFYRNLTGRTKRAGLILFFVLFFYHFCPTAKNCTRRIVFYSKCEQILLSRQKFWWIWNFICMTAIHTFSDYLEPEALTSSFCYFFRLTDF